MHWLWVLIVGAIIGAIAGAITHHSGAMGRISNIIAGLVGSALGEALLGHWGPQLAGMAIIPSLIGAIVVVALALVTDALLALVAQRLRARTHSFSDNEDNSLKESL